MSIPTHMTGTLAPVDSLPASPSPVANTLAAAAGGMADSYLSLRAGTQARGLHGQLVQQLGRMIVAGELGADRPLVPEEIGRRFEVSRTVVRESLRVLEAKGMVTARPNVGTRIRPVPEWNLLDPDVIEWRAAGVAGLDQCRELAELRCAFEPLAAQLAAGRLSDGAAARLSELAVLLKQAAANGDQPGYAKADGEFHALLVAECPNRMVEHLARVVTGAAESAGMRRRSCGPMTDGGAAAHQRLADEVAAGDGAAAASVMRAMLATQLEEPAPAYGLPGQRGQ
ncbi:FadR/GntR family transcriptional regulator [Catenulispora pinisilvae]|uniref:FadR/GntR family transcriptional regulator n=1 Tax=Catenulispora pinisilvae TaxID=2705253 RepID=UPI00189144BF|nr:FCD domain-containing protein [Catenulispora pinisilvae]